ncbi:MAG: hypothetical protein ACLFVP_04725 [Candidatus Bathyarchaeia archaeon]
METETETIWEKLQNIDRRVFYWILFIGLMVPYINPLSLPLTVSPSTRDLYERLQELEEGDTVIINMSFGVSGWPECMPATRACSKIVLREGAKLIIWGSSIDVDMSWDELVTSVPDFEEYDYGEDYVYLGYYTGGESVVAQIASNIRSVFPSDARGTNLDDIPMMKDVNSWEDITLVLSVDTGDWGLYYLRQWQSPYGVPLGEIGIAMLGSSMMPYYRSGNIFGMSVGSRGGAELEQLIGEPGDATVTMDAISVSHLLLVGAIILANIGYFATRGKGGQ